MFEFMFVNWKRPQKPAAPGPGAGWCLRAPEAPGLQTYSFKFRELVSPMSKHNPHLCHLSLEVLLLPSLAEWFPATQLPTVCEYQKKKGSLTLGKHHN